MTNKLIVAPTMKAWVEQAVDHIVGQAKRAIQSKGRFSLVLSGGSTPKPVYQRLAEQDVSQQVNWGNIFLFWGDERGVPPNHPESNYRMAKESLLDHVPIPADNIFRIRGELPPAQAAEDYESRIKTFFTANEKRFDCILLGLGEDGHTASLFPGTPGLTVADRWVVENPHPATGSWRITLTYPAINATRSLLFLVTGENKAAIAADCIQNPNSPPDYPAKKITGSETRPIWLLDQTAASHIIGVN